MPQNRIRMGIVFLNPNVRAPLSCPELIPVTLTRLRALAQPVQIKELADNLLALV